MNSMLLLTRSVDISLAEFSVNMSSLAVAATAAVLGRGCHQGLEYNIQHKPQVQKLEFNKSESHLDAIN